LANGSCGQTGGIATDCKWFRTKSDTTQKNEPLNMTCTAVYQNSDKNAPLSDYVVD
jgi:hypothetical protein